MALEIVPIEILISNADLMIGLTLTESWTSGNQIGMEVELADSLVKGLKLNLNGNIVPSSGAKAAKVGAEFKQAHLFSTVALDVFKGPSVSADAVIGYISLYDVSSKYLIVRAEGFIAGGEVAYNVQDGKVTKFGAALGYLAKEFSVALNGSNNFSTFSVGYYHVVKPELEAGAKAVYDKKNAGNVAIEVGTKYTLDSTTFVKVLALIALFLM